MAEDLLNERSWHDIVRRTETMRCVLLSLAACLLAVPVQAQYGGGGGTADDPYQIWTAEQLNAVGVNPATGTNTSSSWRISTEGLAWSVIQHDRRARELRRAVLRGLRRQRQDDLELHMQPVRRSKPGLLRRRTGDGCADQETQGAGAVVNAGREASSARS